MITYQKSVGVARLFCAVAVLGAAGTSAVSGAVLDTVLTNSNAADNFLFNNSPASNFQNSGLFYYDARQAQLDRARPLIRFDLPTLPEGAVVTGATLRFRVQQYTFINVNNSNAIVAHPFGVHRVLADWSESTSNWNERSAGNAWSAPGMAAGVDYAATATDTLLVNPPNTGTNPGTELNFNITSLYLDWLSNPALNFGVAVRGPAGNPDLVGSAGDTTDGLLNLYNTEFGGAGVADERKPHLILEYTVPAPGSVATLCLGGLVLSRRRR